MRWYPSPFGKRMADDADVMSDSADPNYVPLNSPLVARPHLTSNPYDKGEDRRIAKGEPPRDTQEIIDAVHGRPDHKRVPPPVYHQRVRFVRDEWGDPEPATVIAVQDVSQVMDGFALRPRTPGEPPDANFLINRGQDPMPLVLLMTDDGLYTWTREARVRGACGWMP